jgi:hypothetical protein
MALVIAPVMVAAYTTGLAYGGTVHHLAVGAGKDTNIYVVNRDSMGKFSPAGGNAYQEIDGILSAGIFSMPAYFNNTIYFGPVGNPIMAFAISNAMLSTTPASLTGSSFAYPGASPGWEVILPAQRPTAGQQCYLERTVLPYCYPIRLSHRSQSEQPEKSRPVQLLVDPPVHSSEAFV